MQVPGLEFTESFLSVASDTSTRILIEITSYHEENVWVPEICYVEASFLHPNMEVEISVEWCEVILYLVLITKKLLEEYCILLEKSLYGNVNAEILLLDRSLFNGCNLKRRKSDSCTLF